MNANTLIGIFMVGLALWAGNQSNDPLLAMSVLSAVVAAVYLSPRKHVTMFTILQAQPEQLDEEYFEDD